MSTQYRDFAVLLVTPALAFLFLYLLALPLKKIPLIDAPEDYKPPAWLLPMFALASTFLITAGLAVYVILSFRTIEPSTATFLESYRKRYDLSLPENFKLQTATVTLTTYDGFSDFQIFANGYRVFSSSHNCHLKYQCLPAPDAAGLKGDFDDFQTKSIGGLSKYKLNEQYVLPHQEDFSGVLVKGDNVLDINAHNSGAYTCHLDIQITLKGSEKSVERRIVIVPHGTPVSVQPSNNVLVFHSGAALAAPGLVQTYRTLPADQTLRLCERLRFHFSLAEHQLPDLVKDCDAAIAFCRQHDINSNFNTCDGARRSCQPFLRWAFDHFYAPTVGKP